jgi:hypothetical protein
MKGTIKQIGTPTCVHIRRLTCEFLYARPKSHILMRLYEAEAGSDDEKRMLPVTAVFVCVFVCVSRHRQIYRHMYMCIYKACYAHACINTRAKCINTRAKCINTRAKCINTRAKRAQGRVSARSRPHTHAQKEKNMYISCTYTYKCTYTWL